MSSGLQRMIIMFQDDANKDYLFWLSANSTAKGLKEGNERRMKLQKKILAGEDILQTMPKEMALEFDEFFQYALYACTIDKVDGKIVIDIETRGLMASDDKVMSDHYFEIMKEPSSSRIVKNMLNIKDNNVIKERIKGNIDKYKNANPEIFSVLKKLNTGYVRNV
jgi:hypothetical protein